MSFWLDQADDRTLKTILDELADQGGRSLITLWDGHSPLGYRYDPTFVLLTEWDAAADFERFQAAVRALTKDSL